MYWMSRYMERSDGIIRMLKVNYASSQESVIMSANGDNRGVLLHNVSNRDNSGSVINNVIRARENARSGQDHIPRELWQCMNEFYLIIKNENLHDLLQKEDPITILDSLLKYSVIYNGTVDMTMMRGEGYSFMSIGKYIERSLQVADILAIRFHEGDTDYEVRLLIEQAILNGNFPRSILYSINRMHRYFERLRSERNTEAYNKLNFMIGELHSRVRYSTPESITRQGLNQCLARIKEDLYNIANALNHHYFAYSL